ncbi:hypothetical protein POJ06DRAFT_34473 [Lipomyces tetrasporus]|uniref:Uncharacterized protein n=1 Tax=Lipomyces tetrasporus TaxID=54092 RepID=A0AAD7QM75_9ASCO|nr:uncharacterized protein POJ06DRAFT_34473 [Lipomyces tetrasporus]KAJ8097560.1 hypothetical protein POJ06DRAFT_34473 [Lipomyces tetrasporus]
MPPKKGNKSATSSSTTSRTGSTQRATSSTKAARRKEQLSTKTTSAYFNLNSSVNDRSNEDGSGLSGAINDLESDDREDESDFSADNIGSEDDSEPAETESSEEDYVSAKKRRRGTGKAVAKKVAAAKKSTKTRKVVDDVDDDGEFDSREIFIPKRLPRPLGGINYEPHNIHPNTLLFLEDLRNNNERDWFWDHEAEYRAAKKDFDDFIETLSERMTQIDETIPQLPLKDILFRIYRDIRFTNDKTPYKPYFAAAFSRTGRVGHYAHYYLHLEPGKCRIGGGMWHLSESNNHGLQIMRRLIDRGGKRLKAIIEHPDMSKFFFRGPNLTPLEQFLAMNQGDSLKKNPKGYPKDHKDIQLLRLRSYTVHRLLSNDDFAPGKEPIEIIIPIFRALVPFIQFLNSVIMDQEESEDDQAVETSDDGDH